MVKRLLVAAAWAAAARRPKCMLSLDKTDDGITVCGRLARRIPRSNWFFSFLMNKMTYQSDPKNTIIFIYVHINLKQVIWKIQISCNLHALHTQYMMHVQRIFLSKYIKRSFSSKRAWWPDPDIFYIVLFSKPTDIFIDFPRQWIGYIARITQISFLDHRNINGQIQQAVGEIQEN